MLKKSIICIGKSYFRTKNKKNFEKNKVRKILFIKSGAIGDVLMTTPLLRSVRRHFPDAEITYFVGEWSKDALKNNKNVDRVISFPDDVIFKKKLLKLKKLAKRLSKEKFDLCFVLDWSYLAGLFGYMCAPNAVRIGFARGEEGFAHSIGIPYGDRKHDSEYYLDMARAIGAAVTNKSGNSMELFLSESDKEFADRFAKKKKIGRKIIGIAPAGASNPGQTVLLKRWPCERYIELSNMVLEKTDAKIIFFGGKQDTEVIKKIESRIENGNGRIFDASGKCSIQESAALMKKCKVIVTNDSGAMHIAAAAGVPTISIFGPTNPVKLAPLGKKHKYIWSKIGCAPCYKNGSYAKCRHKKCMYSIKAKDVFDEVRKRLR